MKLTEKQKRFCDEYLIDLNATQAAIRAGYSPKGMNKRVTRMMANEGIMNYIQQHMKDREKRTEITQDKVLKELAAIAFSNGSNYAKVVEKKAYNEKGEPIIDEETGQQLTYKVVDMVLTDDLSDIDKKAIASIKRGKNGIEVSTCDKVRALELLGRHLGMFTNKVEVSGNVNNPFENLTTEELLKLASDKDG